MTIQSRQLEIQPDAITRPSRKSFSGSLVTSNEHPVIAVSSVYVASKGWVPVDSLPGGCPESSPALPIIMLVTAPFTALAASFTLPYTLFSMIVDFFKDHKA